MNEQEYIAQLESLKKENEALKAQLNEKANAESLGDELLKTAYNETFLELNKVAADYKRIMRSPWWRITKPFRFVVGKLMIFIKSKKTLYKLARVAKALLTCGPKSALKQFHRSVGSTKKLYTITSEQRKKEEETVFEKNIKFSVLVPLYNTPINFLDEMIFSVTGQTYKNLELCLADGSDDSHAEVGERVKQLIEKDDRIKYKKLEKNMGISENTNACIAMATGDYLCLFDHDDVLHHSALYENMVAICDHGADFIYTDEAVFEGSGITNVTTYHHKPDYSVDNLRANNYICHFSTFSRKLLEKAGGFDSQYDGSQDHDMILRLTENAQKIYHVRKLMYFWRSHKSSVASDINAKPYAIIAGRKAVHDGVVRATGRECKVTSSKAVAAIYDIEYQLAEKPLISIVVSVTDKLFSLKRLISSMMLISTYKKIELVIVAPKDNDAVKAFYQQLNDSKRVKLVETEALYTPERLNIGAEAAEGKYLVFLSPNTAIITPDWLEQMLMYAQRQDVGAVGAKMVFPDGRLYHAGIIIGAGPDGICGHENYKVPADTNGYMGRLAYARDTSAVCGDCLMINTALFNSVKFDGRFQQQLWDVDLCLRLRKKDLLNVCVALGELCHYPDDDRHTVHQEKKDKELFVSIWKETLKKGDPYYNPNFSQTHLDFRLK